MSAKSIQRADIIGHTHYVPSGHHYATFEWVGPTHAPVEISIDLWHEVGALPWPLQIIERYYERDTVLAVRLDGHNRLWAYWHDWRVRAKQAWQWVSVRLILTAQLWGAAYVPPGEVPSWCHLGKTR